jgi:hypothetical protein
LAESPLPEILLVETAVAKTLLVEIATKNNLPELNYGPKKSDWLNCSPPEILLVGTAMSKNLIGRSPVQK